MTSRSLKRSAGERSGHSSLLLLCVSIVLSSGARAQVNPQDPPAEERTHQAIARLYAQQSQVRSILEVALSPDASTVVWSAAGSTSGRHRLYLAGVRDASTVKDASTIKHASMLPLLPDIPASRPCDQDAPQWSPDGHHIAFLSDCDEPGQVQLFVVDTAVPTSRPRRITHLVGFLSHPQWSPDGREIALLYVERATRMPSPMAPEDKAVGVIDDLSNRDVQRLTLCNVETGVIRQVSPSGLYLFEYDWSRDGKNFVYTASAPPGDDNWYIAQLYTQPVDHPEPLSIYKPRLQIALPRWSPDGKSIAFIQGLMSDEGATGGEIYQISKQGGEPHNLTPARASSPSWFTWLSDGEMLFSEFTGGSTAICSMNLADLKTKALWQGDETIHSGSETSSVSVGRQDGVLQVALTRMSWSLLPEVWFGPLDHLRQVTHINAEVKLVLPRSENITWTEGGFTVQGWLLFPGDYDPAKTYPMLVGVHGGPAWITTPEWKSEDFNSTLFTNLGYFVFYPNDRGSYGEGEKFTQANRREWGFGDLQDMVAGVDEIVKHHPVDADRVGVFGWSYGGSTAMMAAARTNRFRAVVAGAGASNLQSYYGQNSIDQWMFPYFGASVYDDPAAYMRCSAISYVKGAKTPTLILVGERDGEAPPAQSFEFWHALKELKVPTQLVIYADEGHSFFKEKDRIDRTWRTLRWFEEHMEARP